MKKSVLQYLGILLILICYPFILVQAQERGRTDISALDTEIENFMQKWNLQGGTVAIVRNSKLVHSRAFGYSLNHRKVLPGTALHIASLSKPITAVAVLKLAEQGKLSLDAKVFGKNGVLNIHEFSDIKDPRVYNITVKNLLEHTAGWDRETSAEGDPMFNPYHIAAAMGKSGPAGPNTIISYMLTKNLDFDPGHKFVYSNLGYCILGRVVEKISGESYENFVQENIFYPLGMTHMVLAKNDEYNEHNSASSFINIEAMDANGGWKGTSEDLARFLSSLSPADHKHILKDESLSEMIRCCDVNPKYGLGWFVNPKGNFWHTGSLRNCSAFMARLNSGISAVIIFNSRPEDPAFFDELDQVIWKGLKKVTIWPDTDLFQHHTSIQ